MRSPAPPFNVSLLPKSLIAVSAETLLYSTNRLPSFRLPPSPISPHSRRFSRAIGVPATSAIVPSSHS